MSSLPTKGGLERSQSQRDAVDKDRDANMRETPQSAVDPMATTTTEPIQRANSLKSQTFDAAKEAYRSAENEMKSNPKPFLAAALTAVIAIGSMMVMNRRTKHAGN